MSVNFALKFQAIALKIAEILEIYFLLHLYTKDNTSKKHMGTQKLSV